MAARRQTRERLVHAAADQFWAVGYETATLAAIATSAGVPPGNVFYHFPTKADLARAVTALFVAEAAGTLAEIDRRGGDPARRIAAFFDLIADTVASRVARGCPIARATRDFPADAETGGPAQVFRIMIAWLAARLAEAGRADAEAAARAALARWQGAIVLAAGLRDAAILAAEIAALRAEFGGPGAAPAVITSI